MSKSVRFVFNMTEEQESALLKKYSEGQCRPDEIQWIERAYANWNMDNRSSLNESDLEQAEDIMRERIMKQTKPALKRAVLWPRIAAAVVLALCLGVGWSIYQETNAASSLEEQAIKNHIKPGKNSATLTLANGAVIALTGAANGQLVKESGIEINKTADGQLVYKVSDVKGISSRQYNSIETPKGGQYQVTLPDGTNVWLNAASKLSYPVSFATHQNRIVELSGEAYFEVAKDKTHPFIVKNRQQQIRVLGTHFNINGYGDEGEIKTTLLEGSVEISAARMRRVLNPGEESVLKGQQIDIVPANLEVVMAWKNSMFVFDHDRLESIMLKVGRWYDVEIVYQKPELKQETFSGGISRFEQVSDVLKKLSFTRAVKFKIEGRRIFVMK
ncbi:FecR family protein [Pedobacter sp.]|jgi:transmembrane sensor|uniref:FecR family protein n=1 Tax=Pedobacter sp. TaxID=1411316 RepID=UPI002D1830F4|nr:FecR domain-containing protein [Pedobacter sp.]HWW40309.1 FecR domain-containing protein [Pedobacter sp.]